MVVTEVSASARLDRCRPRNRLASGNKQRFSRSYGFVISAFNGWIFMKSAPDAASGLSLAENFTGP
jgi:hypothetical protein